MIKDALTVRNKVFFEEQNYKSGARRDENDDTAWFANVYDVNGNVVATSRMIYTENKNERLLGKIAVLPEFRKFGLGKQMLDALCVIAEQENVSMIYVNAQESALEFYRKIGFEIFGKGYDDENVRLFPMKKSI